METQQAKKTEIKDWLAHIGRDRQWLGDKLGVTKRTIDNWLSTQAEISQIKLAAIQRLIVTEPRADAVLNQPLVLEPTKEQFNRWNSAWRHSRHATLEDWANAGLDELAAEDSSAYPRAAEEANPYKIDPEKEG